MAFVHVAHPASQTNFGCLAMDIPAKAHALHAAFDLVMTDDLRLTAGEDGI